MDFAGDDNNSKCEFVTGKFEVASVTLAFFGVIKDQLLILTGHFCLIFRFFFVWTSFQDTA